MNYLIAATLIWAFSFSLIGVFLAGKVDAYFSAWIRIVIAAALFSPFLLHRPAKLSRGIKLAAIGAIQLGCMYLFYYQSFELLSVPEVLIFTILTPVYVTLIHDAFQKKFSPHYLLTAVIAVAGTAVIRWGSISEGFIWGMLCVQGSNFCFALGQVSYKNLNSANENRSSHQEFGYFYIGALVPTTLAMLLFGSGAYPSTSLQWGVLLWLGLIASGLGYYIWNVGTKRVNSGLLAIMNNALVPAGLLVNVTLWNRDVQWPRLIIGATIILLSLFINQLFNHRLRKAKSTDGKTFA